MINFRFHLVSLVAVFLALTVGIVVGATIVNHAIVTGLNDRIDRVEKNANAQRSQNRALSTTARQLESYLETAAPYVVEGRLTAVPVVVVAERGLDKATVRDLVTLLQDSGAHTPAIVWLESKWKLDKPADRAQLARIMGLAPAGTSLRAAAVAALAHRLGTPVSPVSGGSLPGGSNVTTTTVSATATTTTATKPAQLLDALATAGFVSIEPVGASGTNDLSTFPSAGVRSVVLGGNASDLVAAPVAGALAAAMADLTVPTIAGEVYHVADGAAARGATLAVIRTDGQLAKVVSTVDDVDLVQGRVSVVLATADAGESKVGHYGYGKGADRALPSWAGP
ncbi:MAG TPA: copper transporter [Acidimicrobiia bacterium]